MFLCSRQAHILKQDCSQQELYADASDKTSVEFFQGTLIKTFDPCEPKVILKWPIGPREVGLSPMVDHIWSMHLDTGSEQSQRYWKTLSGDERERAERFQFAADRRRFIVARGVLRILLGRYLNIPSSKVRFRYGEFGKPELEDCHDSELQFNLAHSRDLAICGFTLKRRIGLDVEFLTPRVAAGMYQGCFTVEEQKGLAAQPRASQALSAIALWTRKEAFLKALGCGLQRDLGSFEISVPPVAPSLVWCLGEDAKQSSWTLSHLEPSPNFVGTLCVEHGTEVTFWSWKHDGLA